jgi:mevalonate kinase
MIASTPTKIILFGEPFVVFGEPAIVRAINQRAYSATLSKDGRIHMIAMDLGLAGTFEKENSKSNEVALERPEKNAHAKNSRRNAN